MKPSIQITAEQRKAAFDAFGAKLRRGEKLDGELDTAISFLSECSPSQVGLMAQLVRNEVGLYDRTTDRPFWKTWLAPPGHREQLQRTRKLEFIFLFHSDGRLREAALDKLDGGLQSPFWVAALLFRMNDWAVPVRRAASRCFQRVVPLTSADVVAQAILALLPPQRNWQRWGEDEQTLFRDMCARPEVRAELVKLLITQTVGPLPAALRASLRTPLLDDCLTEIAGKAKNPIVRAIATEALLLGAAKWRSGYRWQWIDKRYNLRRAIPVYSYRPLSCAVSSPAVAERAMADRSPVVRRITLSCAEQGAPSTDVARLCIEKLAGDPAKQVRDLATFLLRRA